MQRQRIVWNCGNSIGGLQRTGSPPFIKQKNMSGIYRDMHDKIGSEI